VLVRAAVRDDGPQTDAAASLLQEAELVALTLPALCEFAWVLSRSYKNTSSEIGAAIATLIGTENVVVDRAAVEAGLAVLDAGGDFADGVIAHEGRLLGGEVFVSFDKKAVSRLKFQGERAELLS
jgi:predicted nucleic-acid-binding protein